VKFYDNVARRRGDITSFEEERIVIYPRLRRCFSEFCDSCFSLAESNLSDKKTRKHGCLTTLDTMILNDFSYIPTNRCPNNNSRTRVCTRAPFPA